MDVGGRWLIGESKRPFLTVRGRPRPHPAAAQQSCDSMRWRFASRGLPNHGSLEPRPILPNPTPQLPLPEIRRQPLKVPHHGIDVVQLVGRDLDHLEPSVAQPGTYLPILLRRLRIAMKVLAQPVEVDASPFVRLVVLRPGRSRPAWSCQADCLAGSVRPGRLPQSQPLMRRWRSLVSASFTGAASSSGG